MQRSNGVDMFLHSRQDCNVIVVVICRDRHSYLHGEVEGLAYGRLEMGLHVSGSFCQSSATWFSSEPGPVELNLLPLDATMQPPRSPSVDFQSSDMGSDGPPDNTARSAMTMPTQIQNQSLVSYVFHAFQINTRQSFAASATAGRLATIHELQPIGGRRGVPFNNVVSRFRSTILVPMSASLCVPGLARMSATPSTHNCCSHSSRASKCRTRPTPRLVAIASMSSLIRSLWT